MWCECRLKTFEKPLVGLPWEGQGWLWRHQSQVLPSHSITRTRRVATGESWWWKQVDKMNLMTGWEQFNQQRTAIAEYQQLIYAQKNDTCQLHCMKNASHLRGKAPRNSSQRSHCLHVRIPKLFFFLFSGQTYFRHWCSWWLPIWNELMISEKMYICIFEMLFTFLKSCLYTSTLKGAWSFWPCLRFIHVCFIK